MIFLRIKKGIFKNRKCNNTGISGRTRNVVDTGFIECYYVTNLIIYFAYIIVEARYSKVV
jgi:hypothetical protein